MAPDDPIVPEARPGHSERARAALDAAMGVEDPELPMLTIGDLGMVRWAMEHPGGAIEVGVAPTYSGCPATEVIHQAVEAAVRDALGPAEVRVTRVRTPAWSTEHITERGRDRLRENGIAPPLRRAPTVASIGGLSLFEPPPAPPCPRCGAGRTTQVSAHGSTPCKSMFRCEACLEPFEHFKCH